MNNYPREQNDAVSVGKPWGKGLLTHDFSAPLASRNPNAGNNIKPIDFSEQIRSIRQEKEPKRI
jgi:hypothetical protein